MSNFIRNTVFACLFILFTSCTSTAYLYKLESKIEAKKDINLQGRKIAILVDDVGIKEDSVAYVNFSLGVASKLEEKLGLAKESLPVYIGDIRSTDGNNKELLSKFSDSDVLFIIDNISGGNIEVLYSDMNYQTGGINNYVAINLDKATYLYDVDNSKLLDREVGLDTMVWNVYSDFDVPNKTIMERLSKAESEIYFGFGESMVSEYFPTWEIEERRFLIYTTKDNWIKAYDYVTDFKWKLAADIWFEIINSSPSPKKISAAAYNLAVVCEINGKYELAEKWLDYSDKTYKYYESRAERMIIQRKSKLVK